MQKSGVRLLSTTVGGSIEAANTLISIIRRKESAVFTGFELKLRGSQCCYEFTDDRDERAERAAKAEATHD